MTFDQKVDRINWCTANLNTNLFNYWFADETSVWENECPKYAYRPKGSYPESVQISSKSSRKLTIWCAISFRGATDFVVSIINTTN